MCGPVRRDPRGGSVILASAATASTLARCLPDMRRLLRPSRSWPVATGELAVALFRSGTHPRAACCGSGQSWDTDTMIALYIQSTGSSACHVHGGQKIRVHLHVTYQLRFSTGSQKIDPPLNARDLTKLSMNIEYSFRFSGSTNCPGG